MTTIVSRGFPSLTWTQDGSRSAVSAVGSGGWQSVAFAREQLVNMEPADILRLHDDDDDEPETPTAPASPDLRFGLHEPLNSFVPRPVVTERLHHALGSCTTLRCSVCPPVAPPSPGHERGCHVAVLHGGGGVGKTQLALHHARLQRCAAAPYRLRWWISAQQRSAVLVQYRDFAVKAGIPFDAEGDAPSLLSAVNDWLSARGDWLVVFDDAQSADIAELLPDSPLPSQHVIITSQHRDWGSIYGAVEVDVMEQTEAAALMKLEAGIAAADRSQDADISALLTELGRLPLAVACAAVYMRQQHILVPEYRRRYLKHSLLDSGDKQQRRMDFTWDISIKAVDEKMAATQPRPLACALLTVCAYLASENIHVSVLRRWLLSSTLLAPVPAPTRQVRRRQSGLLPVPLRRIFGRRPSETDAGETGDEQSELKKRAAVVLETLLATLRAFHLLEFTGSSNSVVSIQRALGSVLRRLHQQQPVSPLASVCPPYDRDWRERLVHAVVEEYKESSPLLALRDLTLLPHMQSLQRRFDGAEGGAVLPSWDLSHARASLLSRQGELYYRLGDFRQAKALQETALNIVMVRDVRDGLYQQSVADAMRHLANTCAYLGDYDRQRELLERALSIRETLPERDELQRSRLLAGLGAAWYSLGDYGKAKERLESALLCQEELSRSQPAGRVAMAATLNNLGDVCGALGERDRQLRLLRRALDIKCEFYGASHVSVATTRIGLAAAYSALGAYQQAAIELEKALAITEAVYGSKTRPELADILTSLGSALGALGDYGGQRQMLQRALDIRRGSPGLQPVEEATALRSLSVACDSVGDRSRGRELLQEAMAIEASISPAALGQRLWRTAHYDMRQLVPAFRLSDQSAHVQHREAGPAPPARQQQQQRKEQRIPPPRQPAASQRRSSWSCGLV